ncbi:MAG: polyprenol monophosphomannose synthase [bacterium]|nr:polyprenol monophosphomannose synthase [bacterium]
MDIKVSVILPTYNEKDNIGDLVLAIDKEVQASKEIIVVDDDSPDGTSQIIQKMIDQHQVLNLRLITRKQDKGLTNSIWEGIQQAHGEIVLWMDCDFSMPPKDIPRLLKKIDEGNDVAVGSRFVKGGSFKEDTSDSEDSWLAVVLSRLMNVFIRMMLGRDFKDYTSGFIAIKRSIFDKITLTGDYGEYFIDLIVRAKLFNFKIIEIPYTCLPREKGESKTGSNLSDYIKRGSKYVWVTLKLFKLRMKYKFFRIV